MKLILCLALVLVSSRGWTSTSNKGLQDQIKNLDVSEDDTPALKSSERLYSYQTRAVKLDKTFELKLIGGQIFSGNDFLLSRQYGAGAQFHFNEKWSLGLGYQVVNNKFTTPADKLLEVAGYIPDVDFAKSRMEAFIDYNIFYGKLRFTKDTIFYFDNYIGLGAAQNNLNSGNSTGPMAHLGFVFWLNKISARLAMVDYYYKEQALLSSGSAHNILGQFEIGYVF